MHFSYYTTYITVWSTNSDPFIYACFSDNDDANLYAPLVYIHSGLFNDDNIDRIPPNDLENRINWPCQSSYSKKITSNSSNFQNGPYIFVCDIFISVYIVLFRPVLLSNPSNNLV